MARNDQLVEVDGAALKRRRLALGLSRPELAVEAGVSENALLATEHEYRKPSDRMARKIFAALDRLEARDPDVSGDLSAAELQEIDRRLQALEAAVRDLVGATQELRHLEPLVSRLEALLRVDEAGPE